MAESKPRQSNMRSEGFFFQGRGQYTIFITLWTESGTFGHAAQNKDSPMRPGKALNTFIVLRAESGTFAHAAHNKDFPLRPGRGIKYPPAVDNILIHHSAVSKECLKSAFLLIKESKQPL